MNKLLSVYKPKGFTPLQMVTKLRKQFPEYEKKTIGYAGRLDPLAHGVLLLMIGEATKNRETYLALSKTYEFTALFGIATDTYDLLGIPAMQSEVTGIKNIQETIDTFIKSHLGKQTQTYPPYSSKAVNGKPLFLWAKENKLGEITIPQREIEIISFEQISTGTLRVNDLQTEINHTIGLVNGDFRQKEIKNAWHQFFRDEKTVVPHFSTARFRVSCSSGTYIRSLVNELGTETGLGAVTLDILRTKVGEYTSKDALKLD